MVDFCLKWTRFKGFLFTFGNGGELGPESHQLYIELPTEFNDHDFDKVLLLGKGCKLFSICEKWNSCIVLHKFPNDSQNKDFKIKLAWQYWAIFRNVKITQKVMVKNGMHKLLRSVGLDLFWCLWHLQNGMRIFAKQNLEAFYSISVSKASRN